MAKQDKVLSTSTRTLNIGKRGGDMSVEFAVRSGVATLPMHAQTVDPGMLSQELRTTTSAENPYRERSRAVNDRSGKRTYFSVEL